MLDDKDCRGEMTGYQIDAVELAITDLQSRQDAEPNGPLTLDELRKMAWAGLAVWCVDTDGTAQGLLCMQDDWDEPCKSPHVWLLDEETNAHVCTVEYMLDFGAKFYRSKLELPEERT